jgi:hypothetical protein
LRRYSLGGGRGSGSGSCEQFRSRVQCSASAANETWPWRTRQKKWTNCQLLTISTWSSCMQLKVGKLGFSAHSYLEPTKSSYQPYPRNGENS